MQAVVGNDPLDAPQANREVGLAQLLGQDRGRGLGIQEAVAQDLAHDGVGAAIIGFGTGLLRFQSEQAALFVGLQELVVALAAKAVLLGDVEDRVWQTLSLQEHEEATRQLIGGPDGELAAGADQLVSFGMKLQRGIHEREAS